MNTPTIRLTVAQALVRFLTQQMTADWAAVTMRAAYHLGHQPLPAQTEVIGVVNELIGPRDVVVQAAEQAKRRQRSYL